MKELENKIKKINFYRKITNNALKFIMMIFAAALTIAVVWVWAYFTIGDFTQLKIFVYSMLAIALIAVVIGLIFSKISYEEILKLQEEYTTELIFREKAYKILVDQNFPNAIFLKGPVTLNEINIIAILNVDTVEMITLPRKNADNIFKAKF